MNSDVHRALLSAQIHSNAVGNNQKLKVAAIKKPSKAPQGRKHQEHVDYSAELLKAKSQKSCNCSNETGSSALMHMTHIIIITIYFLSG